MRFKLLFFILTILICLPLNTSAVDQNEILDRFKTADYQEKSEIIGELEEVYLDLDREEFQDLIQELEELSSKAQIKADLINLLADYYYYHDQLQEALQENLRSYQLVVDLPKNRTKAYTLYSIGSIYDLLEENNKAIEYLEKAAGEYSKLEDYNMQSDIISSIGIIYNELTIYDDALSYYFKALMIYEDLEDREGVANSYVNIGNINQAMRHFNQALDYYFKASDIYKQLDNEIGISNCLNNLGIIYSDLNQNHKALSYYLESLEYAEKLEDKAGIGTTLNNLGIIYKDLGDFDLSLQSYERSLEFSRELNDTWAIANTMGNTGELFIDYGDYIHGLEYLNGGMEISRQHNYIDLLMEGYSILAKYYSNIGDYQIAFENFRNYVTLKDSILVESSKRISEIQSIYQNQRHAKEIEILEIKQELGNNTRLILLAASLILFIIIIWLYFLNKKKKKEIRKRKKLEKNVLRLAHIVDQAETSIIMTDLSGKIIYANKYIEKISGYNSKELIGNNPAMFKSGFTEDDTYKELWNTINTGQVWKGIFLNRKKNGELYFEDAVIFPIKDEKGDLINFAAVKKDITEQITAQNDLKTSEFRFRTMAKKINDGLLIIENNKLVYVNEKFQKITGYDLNDLKRLELSDLVSDNELEQARTIIDEVRSNPAVSRNVEFWVRTKKGDKCCLFCGLTRHKIDKDNSSYYLIVSDITERKRSEEQLLKSLNEKEVLIKEIHHRVKNNMQVVSSLLQLQSRYIKDEETLGIFKKSQNRVKSMALIHEKLYRSDDLSHIDFNEYIRKLTRHLLIFYSIDTNRIRVQYDISEIYLGILQAIPLGLILNELISNSLKYAFAGKEQGLIKISLKHFKDDYFLSFEDDGVGIPKDFDLQNTESLGLQLINSLTEQLHGTLELDRKNGTNFTLTFPRSEKI